MPFKDVSIEQYEATSTLPFEEIKFGKFLTTPRMKIRGKR
jgi:hypothetical protein